jgi:hypothetical protein
MFDIVTNCRKDSTFLLFAILEQFQHPIQNLTKGKIDSPNTHINDRIISWLGTSTLIKVAGLIKKR